MNFLLQRSLYVYMGNRLSGIRNIISKIVLAAVCILLSGLSLLCIGCKHRDASLLKGSAWKAISIDGSTVIENSYISLYFWADGTLWGETGVNTYDTSWACEDNNYLKLGTRPDYGGITDLGGLEELEKQEESYLAALRAITSFKIHNNHLRLYDTLNRERIILQRIPEHRVNSEKLINTEWALKSFNGKSISDNTSMSLFIDNEGIAYGQAGPFWYELTYKTSGDDIRVGGSTTRIRMENIEGSVVGQALTSLHKAGSYNLTEDELEIFTANGDTIAFRRYHSSYVQPSTTHSLVPESGSASWAYIVRDMGLLCADADLIIMGTGRGIIGIEEIQHIQGSYSVLKSCFRVEAVLKGTAGQEMVLNHGIYTTDNITFHVFETNPPIQAEERWILFLSRADDGNYYATGPWGRYQVKNGKVYSMNRILNNDNIYGADLDFNGFDLSKFLRLIVNQLRTDSLTYYEERMDIPASGFGFPPSLPRSGSLTARLDTGWETSGKVTFVVKRLEESGSTMELPVLAGLEVAVTPVQVEVEPGQQYRVVLHAEAAMDMQAGIYWLLVECWQENAVLTSREFFVSIHPRQNQ